MSSHLSHTGMTRDGEISDMNRCQICHEHIWENQWDSSKEKVMGKYLCFFCFSKFKNGDYRPQMTTKTAVGVCDRCGEISENIGKVNSEWLCGDCKAELSVCDRCGEVVEKVENTDYGSLCDDCIE
jgi:formylmethanofuran dehydrogenase subunit E